MYTAFVKEYPEYSHYLVLSIILFFYIDGEENPKYLGSSLRNSSEMENLPTPKQENPNFLGLDCKTMCCRDINQNFL